MEVYKPERPGGSCQLSLERPLQPVADMGSIAREFLEVKDSFSGIQDFVNRVLAEPWKVKGESVTEARLNELSNQHQICQR